MAIRNFTARWVSVFAQNTNNYYSGNSRVHIGGNRRYNSYIGFDYNGILNAIETSSTPATVRLKARVMEVSGVTNQEWDFGIHQLTNAPRSGGMPYYDYGRKTEFDVREGDRTFDITNMSTASHSNFRNLLRAGFRGLVLYGARAQGKAWGVTGNSADISIEVVGTWNTAPTIPSVIAPSAGTRVDGAYRVQWQPSTDAEQSQSELKYQIQVYDGVNWRDYGISPYGATSMVIDFSDLAETTQGSLRIRAGDDRTWSDWDYSAWFEISHNQPPTAPTGLSPIGGTILNYQNDIEFTWSHNHANAQRAFDFRWRPQGSSSWNTLSRTSTNQRYVTSGMTFPIGTIQWQVRTYEQQDNFVSPWSATGIFESSEPTNAPRITEPSSGDVIPSSRMAVSWSTTGEQVRYELQLIRTSDNQVVWADEKNTTQRLLDVNYELENDTEYRIRVRVMDSGGIYSTWSSITFETSFTPPTTPIIELTEQENGRVRVDITNPESGLEGEPNVVRNEVYRRVAGSGNRFIRVANNLPADAYFFDFAVGSGVPQDYYVRAIGDNRTSADSETGTIAVEITEDVFLGTANNPQFFISLDYNPSRTVDYSLESQLVQFKGRSSPVAEFGGGVEKTINLDYTIVDERLYNQFLTLVGNRQPLLYRDSRGRKEYIIVTNISVEDRLPYGWNVSLTPQVIHYDEEV